MSQETLSTTEDNSTKRLVVPINRVTNPHDIAVMAQVNYRMFRSTHVISERFDLKDQHIIPKFHAFFKSLSAKAELKETEVTTPSGHRYTKKEWHLVDRGLVDYMTITYVDQAQLDSEADKLKKLLSTGKPLGGVV